MKRYLSVLIVSIFFLLILGGALVVFAGDKAVFEKEDDKLKAELTKRVQGEIGESEPVIKMDFTDVVYPKKVSEFKSDWHYPPKSQGLTGACWSFSTVSFFESEIYRQSGRKIKLSEIWMTYWEYVDKAARFVRERGNSNFGRGSEANAATRILRKYGIVPAEAYDQVKKKGDFYYDKAMFSEMEEYLDSLVKEDIWNEEEAIKEIKSIMNKHLGPPPEKVIVDGKEMTPVEYFKDVVRLNPDDYVDLMSLCGQPFYENVEYKVWDNWWHSEDHYNIPLSDFMAIVKKAVRMGYTLVIVGDNSEPGYYSPLNIARVPSFDIASDDIDDNARQMRFSNGCTTDDHAIHLVGYTENDGDDWYLIKDSVTWSWNGKHKGYVFYHEDFVKLKMMNIMVHKDVVKKAIGKLPSR
jgi:bleomycin hydrolase